MRRVFLLWAAVLLGGTAMYAQFDTGAVLGTVRDGSGSVVPEAAVTIENLETGARASALTGDEGAYEFPSVRVGRYRINAERTGFRKATTAAFTLNVNTRQRVDIELVLGQTTETVEVSAAATVLETDSSQRGQVVSAEQVVELPLNGRAYSSLVLLTTGVRQSAIGTANISTNREGSFNVNGLRSSANNYLLDGMDNNAYGTSNQGFSNQVTQLPPDSVAQFQVVTNNLSAEYGRSGGATVHVVGKSGGNQFHGGAWEFARNTALNATGFFKPRDNRTPPLHRNQFGFDIGGPIQRNRAFFFADYEGFRQIRDFVTAATIPTVAQRALAGQATYNFVSGGSAYSLPVSSFARKVVEDMPLPTSTASSNNYQFLQAYRDFNDKYDARFDYLLSSKLSAFFRVGQRKQNMFDQPALGGQYSGGDGNGNQRILNQSLGTGVTWTRSPSEVVELRFGVNRTKAGKYAMYIGAAGMQDLFGITGIPTDPRFSGGLNTQVISGIGTFGRQATNPQWQHPTVYNPKVSDSRVIGQHSLRFGFEYQRAYVEVEDVNPLYGRDTYQGAYTGSNYGDFLTGLRSKYEITNYFVAHMRQDLHFAYVQDDWKALPKLTLNLGVRYEYATPYWEQDNKLTNWDPSTHKMIQAKGGSMYDRALVNPDRNNFAPRLGVAWSGIPKTAVRAGFGMSHIHYNRAGSGNLLPINGPQVIWAVVNNPSPLLNGGLNPAFSRTQDGYPSGITDSSKFDPLQANITYIPRDTRTSYVTSWFLSAQRELASNTLVDVAYVGNRSNRLLLFANYNQAVPNAAGQSLSMQARRPISDYGDITYAFNGGFSSYESLQGRFERRMQGGVTLLSSFTWSTSMDNGAGSLENPNGNYPAPQNFYNMAAEKARSAYDQPITSTTSFVWQVPAGKGRRFFNSMHPWAEAAFGGWEMSGINTMTSGQPVTLVYTPASAYAVSGISSDFRGANNYRPNVLGDVKVPSGQRTPSSYLDKTKLALPTASSTSPFGNAGRNIVRSNGFYQLDCSVSKTLAVSERVRLQIRGEAFNILNKTNLGAPSGNFSSGAFGTVTTASDARQLQVALKLAY